MAKRDRSDPALMLAIVAGAILLAVGKALSNIQIDRLLARPSMVAPIALSATMIATALASQRLRKTRAALDSRVSIAVVPADEFKPSIDSVLRLAAQLSRIDRSIGGWFDRRGSALGVSLSSDADGRLAYIVSVPGRARELLRSAFLGYEGVELRDSEAVFADDANARSDDSDETVLRTELVLAKPSIEPLARLSLDPDPLQAFAVALRSLRPGDGDDASVHFDLLPASGLRRTHLRRVLRREAKRRHGNPIQLPEWLGGNGGEGQSREPAELAERRDVASALDAKLRDSGPLFEAQVLVRVRAKDRARAKATMQALLSAFGPLSSRNWLRASGLPIPGLAFIGSDAWMLRRSFDRRFDSGLFRPRRRHILTAHELAGFLKPPTVDCLSENVLRSGALLSPAPPLPIFRPDDKRLIPLGRVVRESGEEIVAVRTADSFFSYVSGRSRFGKTELAIAQFVHLVRSGHGGLFLDPHGDALDRILPYLTEPALARRVVRIDLGPGSASRSQPGWNLFELKGRNAEEAEGRVEAVVDAFSSALEWGDRSTRAINLTTQAATALAAIAQVLPPEKAPTIFQIPTLLTNDEWREAVLPFLPAASRSFWLDRFGRLAEEAITPLTNMIDRLRASSAASTLLGQSQSSYRAREAMDKGLIVLACPGSGGTRDRLLANLLVFDLFHGAKSRGELDPNQRRPFFPFLDEIQSFDGGSSENLAALVEQTAKFGLRGCFLNQNPERLSGPTLNALTTNRSHLISTALNAHAASLLTKEWGGEPSPTALSKLPRYHFIAQVTNEGDLSKPFALGGVRVEEILAAGKPDRVKAIERLSVTPRMSPRDALAHLERLDDEILAELRRLRRGSKAVAASEPADDETAEGFEPVRVARRRS
jgi:hypothetical protein